jgi:hypothetical protein
MVVIIRTMLSGWAVVAGKARGEAESAAPLVFLAESRVLAGSLDDDS